MNQYTELYKEHRTLVCKGGCEMMNGVRDAAFELFEREDFPRLGSEEHQHTDLPGLFSLDYGMNLTRLAIPVNPADAFRCDVPNLSTQLYFLANDAFYASANPKGGSLPEGVLAGSLNDIAKEHPELIGRYYNKLVELHATSGEVSLNTMFAQDGFLLYVPKNTVVEKPIQLVSLLRGDVDMLVNRRLLIIVEQGAEAKLLICDHAMDEHRFLANQVTEVFVGEGATFDLYELEETNSTTHRVCSTFVKQDAGSNMVVNGTSLMSGTSRNNYHVVLAGEGAETSLTGISILDTKQKADVNIFIDHAVPHCTSSQLFKFVLDDEAQGAFAGKVLVREDAQKTIAYQSNKNICASADARMYTKPQLEIYADDVKCSHGATVGQLDEAALFYMRSRGLSEEESRMLLKFAFAGDVIESIRFVALKDRLRQLIEKRFRGELARCRNCEVCR